MVLRFALKSIFHCWYKTSLVNTIECVTEKRACINWLILLCMTSSIYLSLELVMGQSRLSSRFAKPADSPMRSANSLSLKFLIWFDLIFVFVPRRLCKTHSLLLLPKTPGTFCVVSVCTRGCARITVLVLFFHHSFSGPSPRISEYHHHTHYNLTTGGCELEHAESELYEGHRLFLTDIVRLHLCCSAGIRYSVKYRRGI